MMSVLLGELYEEEQIIIIIIMVTTIGCFGPPSLVMRSNADDVSAASTKYSVLNERALPS